MERGSGGSPGEGGIEEGRGEKGVSRGKRGVGRVGEGRRGRGGGGDGRGKEGVVKLLRLSSERGRGSSGAEEEGAFGVEERGDRRKERGKEGGSGGMKVWVGVGEGRRGWGKGDEIIEGGVSRASKVELREREGEPPRQRQRELSLRAERRGEGGIELSTEGSSRRREGC